MKYISEDILLYWRDHGTLSLIKKALPFIFSYVPLNYYCIYSIPKIVIRPKCQLYIRKGSLNDISLISSVIAGVAKEILYLQIKYLLDTGGEIFIAFCDGEPAHVARVRYYPGVLKWNHFERDPLIALKQDEVYIGHSETNARFKGLNIYPAVLQHIIKYSFENGKIRCFGSSSPLGKVSIRGIEKAGFYYVGRKRRYRVFGKIYDTLWSSDNIV